MRLGLFWFVFVEGWMNSKEDEAVSGSQLRSRTGKMIIKAKRERKTLLRCFHERRLFPIHSDARTRLWNHNGSRESCGRRWLGGKIISLLNVHLNAFFFLPSSGGDQVCGSRPDGPSRFVSSKTRGLFFPLYPSRKRQSLSRFLIAAPCNCRHVSMASTKGKIPLFWFRNPAIKLARRCFDSLFVFFLSTCHFSL